MRAPAVMACGIPGIPSTPTSPSMSMSRSTCTPRTDACHTKSRTKRSSRDACWLLQFILRHGARCGKRIKRGRRTCCCLLLLAAAAQRPHIPMMIILTWRIDWSCRQDRRQRQKS